MADNKKSFLLYADIIHTVEKMPKLKQADLFMTILKYVNDRNPEVSDLIVGLVWEPIKLQLKRDLKKYEDVKTDKSISGKLGNLKKWNPDLFDRVLNKEIALEEAENIAKHRRTSHSDKVRSQNIANVAVTDTDTVNDTDINVLLEKEPKAKFSFRTELEKIGFDKNLVAEWLRVRKTKRATDTETALKKYLSEIEKSGAEKNYILKLCVENSWSGFKAEYLLNLEKKHNGISQSGKPAANSKSAGAAALAEELAEQLRQHGAG